MPEGSASPEGVASPASRSRRSEYISQKYIDYTPQLKAKRGQKQSHQKAVNQRESVKAPVAKPTQAKKKAAFGEHANEIVEMLEKEARRLEERINQLRQSQRAAQPLAASHPSLPGVLVADSQLFDDEGLRLNDDLVEAIKNKLKLLEQI